MELRIPARRAAPPADRSHVSPGTPYCGGSAGGILNTSHAGVWLFSPSG